MTQDSIEYGLNDSEDLWTPRAARQGTRGTWYQGLNPRTDNPAAYQEGSADATPRRSPLNALSGIPANTIPARSVPPTPGSSNVRSDNSVAFQEGSADAALGRGPAPSNNLSLPSIPANTAPNRSPPTSGPSHSIHTREEQRRSPLNRLDEDNDEEQGHADDEGGEEQGHSDDERDEEREYAADEGDVEDILRPRSRAQMPPESDLGQNRTTPRESSPIWGRRDDDRRANPGWDRANSSGIPRQHPNPSSYVTFDQFQSFQDTMKQGFDTLAAAILSQTQAVQAVQAGQGRQLQLDAEHPEAYQYQRAGDRGRRNRLSGMPVRRSPHDNHMAVSFFGMALVFG